MENNIMEELLCSICQDYYDVKKKIPRLFPSCGHSFCSSCLRELISNSPLKVVCPDDNIVCDFYVPEKGIKCFPVNFALQKYLTLQTLDKLQKKRLKVKNEDYCEEHHQKLKLICISDQKLICSDCVIFGDHKDHDFKNFSQFRKDVKSKLESIDDRKILISKNIEFLED